MREMEKLHKIHKCGKIRKEVKKFLSKFLLQTEDIQLIIRNNRLLKREILKKV